jgi:hypothetical protein
MQRQKVISDWLFPDQSRFTDHQSLAWLDGKRFAQARFAALRSILVNDAAFGCLIDGRDHCLHVLHCRFRGCARNAFLYLAQASKDTSIAERAHCCLTSALGGRFCVSHWET